jgi:hypothetical protein
MFASKRAYPGQSVFDIEKLLSSGCLNDIKGSEVQVFAYSLYFQEHLLPARM